MDKIHEIDKNSCWYQQSCVDEMNRFYDIHKDNIEVRKHFSIFSELLQMIDQNSIPLIDLGCGNGMLSEYCHSKIYDGCDLAHIIDGCSERNYNFTTIAIDIVNEKLKFIKLYDIVVMNGVLDIMQYPLSILNKVLSESEKYVIIHRQEITEKGETHTIKNESYGGYTYHSVISREDFNRIIEENKFEIIKELNLEFTNWENNGSSFLLKKCI